MYSEGHAKRDPVTKSVAIRTIFPDEPPFVNKAWLVATPNRGAHDAATSEVEAWDDLPE